VFSSYPYEKKLTAEIDSLTNPRHATPFRSSIVKDTLCLYR